MSLTEALIENYRQKIEEITLIPSSGGVFEVMVNGQLIFSKKTEKRFPEHEEIIASINQMATVD